MAEFIAGQPDTFGDRTGYANAFVGGVSGDIPHDWMGNVLKSTLPFRSLINSTEFMYNMFNFIPWKFPP